MVANPGRKNRPVLRPRAFIGSSREHIDLARAVQENLEFDIETRVWDQDAFRLSRYPLEELHAQLAESDFGVFILAPVDVATIRGEDRSIARDNVVFELGFFAGHLGYRRTFVVVPRTCEASHLPTDLQGLTVGDYDPDRSDGNLTAALGPVCNKIRRLIVEQSSEKCPAPTGLGASGYFADFDEDFARLIPAAEEMELFFIHSRRWRESHNELIQGFLTNPKALLTVFLPNLANDQLIARIVEHFDDGPHIPGLVADAYRYFAKLKHEAAGTVSIRLFDLYPTYSFYGLDGSFVVAMYPTTAIRKSVPAFVFEPDGRFAAFVRHDVEQLVATSHEPSPSELDHLRKKGLGGVHAER